MVFFLKKKVFVLFSLILFLSACIDLTGLVYSPQCGDSICDASEEETCFDDCEIINLYHLFEQGDQLLNLSGRNEFEGQKLSIRIDGFKWVDEVTPEVKLTLLLNGEAIQSRFFAEYTRVHEIYPIKDTVFVETININDYRNYRTVSVQYIRYSGN
jgi:hypothetical protein